MLFCRCWTKTKLWRGTPIVINQKLAGASVFKSLYAPIYPPNQTHQNVQYIGTVLVPTLIFDVVFKTPLSLVRTAVLPLRSVINICGRRAQLFNKLNQSCQGQTSLFIFFTTQVITFKRIARELSCWMGNAFTVFLLPADDHETSA